MAGARIATTRKGRSETKKLRRWVRSLHPPLPMPSWILELKAHVALHAHAQACRGRWRGPMHGVLSGPSRGPGRTLVYLFSRRRTKKHFCQQDGCTGPLTRAALSRSACCSCRRRGWIPQAPSHTLCWALLRARRTAAQRSPTSTEAGNERAAVQRAVRAPGMGGRTRGGAGWRQMDRVGPPLPPRRGALAVAGPKLLPLAWRVGLPLAPTEPGDRVHAPASLHPWQHAHWGVPTTTVRRRWHTQCRAGHNHEHRTAPPSARTPFARSTPGTERSSGDAPEFCRVNVSTASMRRRRPIAVSKSGRSSGDCGVCQGVRVSVTPTGAIACRTRQRVSDSHGLPWMLLPEQPLLPLCFFRYMQHFDDKISDLRQVFSHLGPNQGACLGPAVRHEEQIVGDAAECAAGGGGDVGRQVRTQLLCRHHGVHLPSALLAPRHLHPRHTSASRATHSMRLDAMHDHGCKPHS